MSTAALLFVGVPALAGVSNTEFVAPIDVFDHVPFHSQPAPGMKVVVIAPTKSPIRTHEGVTVTNGAGTGVVLDWEAARGRVHSVAVGAAP